MKKILFCLFLGLALLCGCSETVKNIESDYTIKVTGSENLKFSGHYTFVGTGGVPKPINVEGTLSGEYKGKGMAAVCVFRKKAAEGTLKVDILKADKVVSTAETTQPFGIISLGKLPGKESLINQLLGKILG
ncbi:MAG: hypothetical protein CSYNP_03553 [Syntrophus sp. SKADARSKE-3]|nr:hypothetical protein [Syntrophus sp. SKADARSKE-3]